MDVASFWSNKAGFYTKSFKQKIHSYLLPKKQDYIVSFFHISANKKIHI